MFTNDLDLVGYLIRLTVICIAVWLLRLAFTLLFAFGGWVVDLFTGGQKRRR